MKIKRLLAFILTSMLLISSTGCGNKAKTDETSSNGEISGKIVVWSWDVACKSLQDSAAKFKEKYPKVEFEFQDLGNDQVYDKLTTGLASGMGLPDVVSVEGDRGPTFVSKFPEGFVDLTNEVKKEEFLPVKISECSVNNKLYAFPWDGAPAGLFYRKDYFKKAGINVEDIKTWDDFIEAGKKMDKIGVKMLPMALSKGDVVYRLILNELGSYYFDKNGNTVLNSAESVKAMTIVKKIADAKISFDNANWDGLVTATKSGKIATVPNGVWWAGTLQDECKDESGKWGVMKLPAVEAGGNIAAVNGGSNIMIPAASKNKAAAVAFVKFAMTDKDCVINSFTKYGLYPSYIPVYSDPVFDTEVEYFGGEKIWKFFSEVGKQIPELNYTENSAETSLLVIDAQARVTLKGADVKTTMDELQKTVVGKFGK